MVRFIPINPMADSLLGTQLINYIFFSQNLRREVFSLHTLVHMGFSAHMHIYTHSRAQTERSRILHGSTVTMDETPASA